MVAVAGVTAIDESVAAGTVTVVLAVLPLKLAVINADPGETPVLRPLLDVIVATVGVAET